MVLKLGDLADVARNNQNIIKYLENSENINFWEELKIIED
jgi:hypothetical protein